MKLKGTLRTERPLLIAEAGFALAMLTLAALCIGAAAEDEKSADYWYEKSLELYNNGSLEESLHAIDKAIKIDPQNATLWAHKASCLNMAGVITQNQSRFDESLQSYDKAIELDPENTTYLLWKGYAFRQAAYGSHGVESTRAFEEALKVFDNALKIDPKYAQAWSGKGVIYDDLAIFNDDFARYNDSLAAHDKALQLTPANDSKNLAQAYEGKAVVLSHLGQSLAAIGRKDESKASLEEAVENYDKVIELDPELVGQEALQNRAEVLDELGRRNESSKGFKKAMERLNRSIEESPTISGAWVSKAFLFRELGRYEAAVEALNNATQITPEYVLAWEVKGEILSNELGRFDESIEAYERALQLDATDIKAWIGKGDALRSLGRNREAVHAYECAIAIDHDSAAAWSGKGAALRNMGRYNESIQAYDGALHAIDQKLGSSSASLAKADAWFGKAEALVGPDRADEAADACNQSLQAYEKATQIDPESAKAWTGKGNVLLSLKRYNEPIQAYERALEILNQSIEMNPKDSESWWLKAENLDNLGRSEAALEAYNRVIDLNSSKALGSWIRKSDIFVSLGRYNESVEAFDGTLNLLPTDDKQSVMNLWWTKGITVYHNAWIADGQIIRITSAWYNESSGNFENIMLVNSDATAFWHNPNRGKNVSPDGKPLGKNDEALQAWSTNWAQYGFLDDGEVGMR
ncbi:MAG: tetratricopeptide repeat protein [Methanothrix sp.]|nr:tetratricopeptide repeat protein [Methanothrix sp.]